MSARFLAILRMEEMVGPDGVPLKNRNGKQLYRVLQPFPFYSAILGVVITTPAGFVTDLDSTPRLPLIYLLMNGFGDMPSVTHDYLYSTGAVSRAKADSVLKEACIATGVPVWKANLIWAGVRLGGAGHYGPSTYKE